MPSDFRPYMRLATSVFAPANFMTLVSRGLPIYSGNSSGSDPVANAIDSDYNTAGALTGLPGHYTIDISTAVAAMTADANGKKTMVVSIASNEADYYNSLSALPQSMGSYTIETNTAASAGSEPGSGFSTFKTVTGAVTKSVFVIIPDVTGINWLKINPTLDCTGGTTGSKVNIDLWNATGCCNAGYTRLNCGIFTMGDSITEFGLSWYNRSGVSARNCLGDQVFAATGKRTFQHCAGHEGYNTAQLAALINNTGYAPSWIGKWATSNLGTNDALGSVSPSVYQANQITILSAYASNGIIPVLPTIPWTNISATETVVASLNATHSAIFSAVPTAIPGPDLHSIIQANPTCLQSSNVHPTPDGYRDVYMGLCWKQWCIDNGVY